MTSLTLALDWTANINHLGFFVALEKGFYTNEGLDVQITTPDEDNYQLTPAKKVELGLADFALCPTESIISYRTKTKPFPLIAIAAILQSDLSAVVTKKSGDISSPKDLDGRSYGSYMARYEDGIVKEMVKNDGGKGDIKITYPKKLGIWDTVINDETDATWIFVNWEGVEAKKAGVELNYFNLKDFGIPYSYSPVLGANESLVAKKKETYQAFLRATKKGFLYHKENELESLEILRNKLPKSEKDFDLASALAITKDHFGDENSWGKIDISVLNDFLAWLREKGLEKSEILSKEIFTNTCL